METLLTCVLIDAILHIAVVSVGVILLLCDAHESRVTLKRLLENMKKNLLD